jgi:hypothetical protein
MILYYDMWPNVNMPRGTFKMDLIQNINIRLVDAYVGTKKCAYKPKLHTYLFTYLNNKIGR